MTGFLEEFFRVTLNCTEKLVVHGGRPNFQRVHLDLNDSSGVCSLLDRIALAVCLLHDLLLFLNRCPSL